MLKGIEELLIHNSINEVIHGMPETLGTRVLFSQEGEIKLLAKEWSQRPSESLMLANRDLIIACIRTALTELGDEFETRVGVEPLIAQAVVDRLSSIEAASQ